MSFGVDGLNIKVGGWRSECHRHVLLGGSGACPPEKIQNLEGQICRFVGFGKQFCNTKNNFQQET